MTAMEAEAPSASQLDARRRWVELLRSDKYKQLSGYLSTDDGSMRCCLGVACDEDVTGKPEEWVPTSSGGPKFRSYESLDETTFYTSKVLPKDSAIALGFNDAYPYVFVSETTSVEPLTVLNDSGTPFEEIADLIEKTYITPYEVL